MTTALALINQNELEAVERLDVIVQQSQAALIEAEEKPMLKAILMGRAMNMIRENLKGAMLEDLKKLAGTPFGFKTDKDWENKSYDDRTICDVATLALLDGARITGNEFNIIAGGYYRTKEQLERRVREWPGLTNLRVELGTPSLVGEGGALVSCWATWKLNGEQHSIACAKTEERDTRIPIRVNKGMGADAIFGKAKRKLYHRIWEILKGCDIEDFDGESRSLDSGDVVDGQATVVEPLGPTEPNGKASETNGKASETNGKASETNGKASETTKSQNADVKPEKAVDPKEAYWKDYFASLRQCEEISAVNKLRDKYFAPDACDRYGWNDLEISRGEDAAEAQRARIRESRGSRSNKKS